MAKAKTQVNDGDVQAFLDKVSNPTQRADCAFLMNMLGEVTGCEAKMWGSSIIGFDEYHYVYASGREGDWPIIGFSPRAKNLSIYIMPGFESFQDQLSRLGKHKTGKSCLYVNSLADIDTDILKALAVESVAKMRKKYPAS